DRAREPPLDLEPADRLLGEPAAHGDEAEHGPEEEVEQVVARVQRGEADREGAHGEGHAARGEVDPPPRAHAPPERLRRSVRAPHTGTSTSSRICSSTREASSWPSGVPFPLAGTTRWAKQGITRSRTSAGTR